MSGKKRSRMHGGAPGSGAPLGNKNALKHGVYTRTAIAERRHAQELSHAWAASSFHATFVRIEFLEYGLEPCCLDDQAARCAFMRLISSGFRSLRYFEIVMRLEVHPELWAITKVKAEPERSVCRNASTIVDNLGNAVWRNANRFC